MAKQKLKEEKAHGSIHRVGSVGVAESDFEDGAANVSARHAGSTATSPLHEPFSSPPKSATQMLPQENQELLQSWSEVDENEVQEQSAASQNSVVSLDLSPLELQEVNLEKSCLRFREPLVLTPSLDESAALLVIENNAWELYVFAPTREQLWEELREQIAMLWREYAQEDDGVLSPPALAFKRYLLRHIEEFPLEDDALVS